MIAVVSISHQVFFYWAGGTAAAGGGPLFFNGFMDAYFDGYMP